MNFERGALAIYANPNEKDICGLVEVISDCAINGYLQVQILNGAYWHGVNVFVHVQWLKLLPATSK